MANILHLSDLHRSPDDHVSNDELVSALLSDRARWPDEMAHQVELIVVSGDVVQGARIGEPESERIIQDQYADANRLLTELTDTFLGGDRRRVVIVPGNHDVDWNRARAAMRPVTREELKNRGVRTPRELFDPGSKYRWSWSEGQCYEVFDRDKYESRFSAFREFRAAFYADVQPYPIIESGEIFFAEYRDLDLSIVGLSSCFGIDCFCDTGAFNPDHVALAQRLISHSGCRLHVGVWHHSVSGPPSSSDFLDIDHVHRLIDFGFRVGLHGHHHRTHAVPLVLRLPTEEKFALVSAGSLAAGRRELPVGVHRQYSLIEILPADYRLRVHVREAMGTLIFAASRRTELGGESSIDLEWSQGPAPLLAAGGDILKLDGAQTELRLGHPELALEVLAEISHPHEIARRIRMEAYERLGDNEALVTLLTPPNGGDELTVLVKALCALGRTAEARVALTAASSYGWISTDISNELQARIDFAESTT